MKNLRICMKILIVFSLVISLIAGCGKTNMIKPNNNPGASTAAESAEPVVVDPQADFIKGAKEFLSTDLVALLTEKDEDGTAFVGMLSDFLYDLNNSTAQTNLTLTLNDLTIGSDTLDDSIFLAFDALHDSKSGDSSLELSAGLGTENAKKAGIYVTGDKAVLKPGSTAKDIMLYTMPAVNGAGSTFLDKASVLLTGLMSDDGKAYTLDSNLTDRQTLCDRYLDPWITDTAKEDYTDTNISKTLAGKDVSLRAVSLNMSGQKAYDFVLSNMQKLQADPQFADTDKLLGGIMGLFSADIAGIVSSIIEGSDETKVDVSSAVGKLVTELQALTADEISAAKFIVSIYFDGEKPIGIDIEASTTGKAFELGGVLYRSGLEHQLNLHYKYLDGTTASIELSTVNTGGDNFDVSGKLNVVDATGLEVLSGGYSGKLVETDAKYDLNGDINLVIQTKDDEGNAQKGTVGGNLTLGITHDDTGYTGQGLLDISLTSEADPEDGLSAKIQLDAKLTKQDAVTITPPMYTSANVITVTGKQDLIALHSDIENLDTMSGPIQTIMLLLAFVIAE